MSKKIINKELDVFTIRQFLYKNGIKNEFLIKTLERTYKEELKSGKDWKSINKISKLLI